MGKLSSEQISTFKYSFDMFDKDGDGLITAPEFKDTMQGIGLNATEEEVVEMIKTVSGKETIDFDQFLQIMNNESPAGDSEDDLVCSFKALDPQDTGKCNVYELKHCLMNLSKVLNEDEIGALIGEAKADADGMMDYKAFARKLFASV